MPKKQQTTTTTTTTILLNLKLCSMDRKTSKVLWHNGWVGLNCEYTDFHLRQLLHFMLYDNVLYTIQLSRNLTETSPGLGYDW
jgi:hypothetical protein